ncbi:hypothetical protein G9A89_004207 [Geosiphon pyriformis]|nr:hypothetical protein G9A89_004207 [Geosiphon pyriformis]
MLQNDSEKTYIKEPNKKIAQAIFLLLVKIAQLVSIGNKKKLVITAKKIQDFEFMSRIDVLVNMAEEKIINKGEIISTSNKYQQHYRKETKNLRNKFKVATTLDITTLEYYQLIYTHCKQRFEILKRDLLKNILHYSNTESENIRAEACATYFEELDYNIIRFCEEKYFANAQFAFELKSEPETTKNQSEHSETAANKENNSEITEEESIDSENEEDEMTTYIAKIPDFNGEDIETSPQE